MEAVLAGGRASPLRDGPDREAFGLVIHRVNSPVVGGPEPRLHRFGVVEVDLRAAEVRREGRLVALSAKEFKLLRHFLQHPGTPLGRNELLDAVWGAEAMPTTRTVDVHVAWLRRKLEDDPRRPALIVTVRRVGYKFVA